MTQRPQLGRSQSVKIMSSKTKLLDNETGSDSEGSLSDISLDTILRRNEEPLLVDDSDSAQQASAHQRMLVDAQSRRRHHQKRKKKSKHQTARTTEDINSDLQISSGRDHFDMKKTFRMKRKEDRKGLGTILDEEPQAQETQELTLIPLDADIDEDYDEVKETKKQSTTNLRKSETYKVAEGNIFPQISENEAKTFAKSGNAWLEGRYSKNVDWKRDASGIVLEFPTCLKNSKSKDSNVDRQLVSIGQGHLSPSPLADEVETTVQDQDIVSFMAEEKQISLILKEEPPTPTRSHMESSIAGKRSELVLRLPTDTPYISESVSSRHATKSDSDANVSISSEHAVKARARSESVDVNDSISSERAVRRGVLGNASISFSSEHVVKARARSDSIDVNDSISSEHAVGTLSDASVSMSSGRAVKADRESHMASDLNQSTASEHTAAPDPLQCNSIHEAGRPDSPLRLNRPAFFMRRAHSVSSFTLPQRLFKRSLGNDLEAREHLIKPSQSSPINGPEQSVELALVLRSDQPDNHEVRPGRQFESTRHGEGRKKGESQTPTRQRRRKSNESNPLSVRSDKSEIPSGQRRRKSNESNPISVRSQDSDTPDSQGHEKNNYSTPASSEIQSTPAGQQSRSSNETTPASLLIQPNSATTATSSAQYGDGPVDSNETSEEQVRKEREGYDYFILELPTRKLKHQDEKPVSPDDDLILARYRKSSERGRLRSRSRDTIDMNFEARKDSCVGDVNAMLNDDSFKKSQKIARRKSIDGSELSSGKPRRRNSTKRSSVETREQKGEVARAAADEAQFRMSSHKAYSASVRDAVTAAVVREHRRQSLTNAMPSSPEELERVSAMAEAVALESRRRLESRADASPGPERRRQASNIAVELATEVRRRHQRGGEKEAHRRRRAASRDKISDSTNGAANEAPRQRRASRRDKIPDFSDGSEVERSHRHVSSMDESLNSGAGSDKTLRRRNSIRNLVVEHGGRRSSITDQSEGSKSRKSTSTKRRDKEKRLWSLTPNDNAELPITQVAHRSRSVPKPGRLQRSASVRVLSSQSSSLTPRRRRSLTTASPSTPQRHESHQYVTFELMQRQPLDDETILPLAGITSTG